jgi:putative ABC transport system substrate-binding protein
MHFRQWKRREFIMLLGGAGALPFGSRPVSAQRREQRLAQVGMLDFFPSATSANVFESFREGLREFGYVEGRNIYLEYHSAEERSDLAATLAADMVRRRFDIIVALATPAAHAVKSATTTIPVLISVADPLATGLVASLARPGGNLTGVSGSGPDLAGKRLQLLRDLRPGLARVAFLGAANDPNARTFLNQTQAAADSIHVRLQPLLVAGPEEFETAFAAMVTEHSDGLIVQPAFLGHRAKLAELAVRHRLPMIGAQRQFALAGAIASYGDDLRARMRRLAYYADKILNGAKPADLPVEQPTKFEMVINLKTAKTLGLTVPDKLLALADEVIE